MRYIDSIDGNEAVSQLALAYVQTHYFALGAVDVSSMSAQGCAEWLSFQAMNQSHQDESIANGALARRIKQVMPGRETSMESRIPSGAFPNITITESGFSPVVIVDSWMRVPEHVLQEVAAEHLGKRIRGQLRPVEAVIALRYPEGFEFVENINAELKKTKDLEYCAFFWEYWRVYLSPPITFPKIKRLPKTDWFKGSVSDLADLIHLVDVPETAEQARAKLESGGKNIYDLIAV